MLLTEEMAAANPVKSLADRQRCIIDQEQSLMALEWDRTKFNVDVAKIASRLLAVIAFSDHKEPIDLNLLSDDSSGDAPPQRGTKRTADKETPVQKPAKKQRRPNSTVIPPKTRVACLTRQSDDPQWVLGRVARYVTESKKYEVIDDDGEDVYKVSKKNIRVIPKKPQAFEPKKRVLAVYPHTTVFYPAVLVSRRGSSWLVLFDDEDVEELNQPKQVDGCYIMLP